MDIRLRMIVIYMADVRPEEVRTTFEMPCFRLSMDTAFLISGIVVFADKVIDDETCQKAKEWIRMTKVGRAFEMEKEQYGDLRDAQRLVEAIERAAEGFHLSVDEACDRMHYSKLDYDRAKKLVAVGA